MPTCSLTISNAAIANPILMKRSSRSLLAKKWILVSVAVILQFCAFANKNACCIPSRLIDKFGSLLEHKWEVRQPLPPQFLKETHEKNNEGLQGFRKGTTDRDKTSTFSFLLYFAGSKTEMTVGRCDLSRSLQGAPERVTLSEPPR